MTVYRIFYDITLLNYSFAGLDSFNWTMKSLDPWMDLEVSNYWI